MDFLAKPKRPNLNDGKHWEADKLNRKKVADYLTPLIESITQPFVISLASDYGTGKTFFIECWRKDLEAKGLSCVYFNAWETDFSQDPLFAFIAAMKRELAPLTGADAKFNEAAKKAGGLAAKKLVKIGGKALLRLALGGEAAGDLLDATKISEEDLVKAVDDYAEERLRSQESAEKSLHEFKAYLTATVQELVAKKSDAHKKIVIFVDDLDRCRPDYAISVLECIKHLFSVQGLVFVLSIDNRQLHQAVKAVYGPSIDSEGYLRRFIDWRFRIPEIKRSEFVAFLFERFDIPRLKHFSKVQEFNDASALRRIFSVMCDFQALTLREIEQLSTDLNLYLRLLNDKDTVFDEVLGVIIALRGRFPNEIRDLAYGIKNAYEIVDLLPRSIDHSLFLQKYGSISRFHRTVVAWFLNSKQVNALGKGIDPAVANPKLGASISLGPSPDYTAAVERLGPDKISELYGYWQHCAQTYQLYNISIGQLVYERLEQVERFK